jgi:hypothetical protein
MLCIESLKGGNERALEGGVKKKMLRSLVLVVRMFEYVFINNR